MTRIVSTKDNLLKDSCSWILKDSSYLKWLNGEGSGLLWIHGDPGKGKTMMTIALISHISEQLTSGASDVLSYFFCQNTVPALNRATSVLRGLIYLLLSQHKNLIYHLRKPYSEAGKPLFEGLNASWGHALAIYSRLVHAHQMRRIPRLNLGAGSLLGKSGYWESECCL